MPSLGIADLYGGFVNLLALVRSGWGYGVDALEPLGSGARHWRADARGRPTLLVTLHDLADRDPVLLEDTLAATADLAFALDFVVSSLPSTAGTWTLPAGAPDRAVSVTPWVSGEPAVDDLATPRLLARLHAAHPPRRAPRWAPVPVERLERLQRLAGAAADVAAYQGLVERLVERAHDRPWVPTHGDPGPAHQHLTPVRALLTGWSALSVAPPERDGTSGDPDLVSLFVLERRLLSAMGRSLGP